MPLITPKLANASLRQQVADRIRNGILEGSLRPGERLVERKLAEGMGTSLTAIREALVQLESEGYITKKPNSATFVTEFHQKDLENTLAVRRLLEGYACEEAARRATDAYKQLLQDLFVEAVDVARKGDRQAYIHADLRWHLAVWQATGNDCLVEALRRVVLPLFGFSSISVASRLGFDLVQDAHSHLPLLQAVLRNDPEEARRAFAFALEGWTAQAFDYLSNLPVKEQNS
jgi:DNA-binding GntR family transcriptional regulator